ncbi:hypothetical protein SynA1524_02263 [Synechococcus sp. A15-24]|nr:hypothetical protein SynA1524_02263 [Synechococcus sp. A15-24]
MLYGYNNLQANKKQEHYLLVVLANGGDWPLATRLGALVHLNHMS